jgi:hypothetical protein
MRRMLIFLALTAFTIGFSPRLAVVCSQDGAVICGP